jgi:hypothetical protein
MQPHCARLVVAGRRRDRDDPRALASARTVKRRSGRPSHGPPSPRRGTASPPPTHPVYTAAPSVKGSAGKLGCYSKRVKDYFQKELRSTKRASRSSKRRLRAGLLVHVNVIPVQTAKLGCESGMASHPSVDRQSPFLRPCCTLVRRAGLFVPSRSRHSREAFTSRAAQAALFLRRGSRRANLTASSSLAFRDRSVTPRY